uniref:Uncharacterized protein n=1 Tax=Phlebotomus papatasi TaxID=29031 RepID=A0A1B0D3B7_PHLPP
MSSDVIDHGKDRAPDEVVLFIFHEECHIESSSEAQVPSECPTHYHTTSENVTVSWSPKANNFADDIFRPLDKVYDLILNKTNVPEIVYDVESDPMCLDEDKLLVTRFCTIGGWKLSFRDMARQFPSGSLSPSIVQYLNLSSSKTLPKLSPPGRCQRNGRN